MDNVMNKSVRVKQNMKYHPRRRLLQVGNEYILNPVSSDTTLFILDPNFIVAADFVAPYGDRP